MGDAVGDAVAGPNSPGEPLDFLAAHTFGGRKLYPGAAAFGLVASCETPWALTLAQPDVAPAIALTLTASRLPIEAPHRVVQSLSRGLLPPASARTLNQKDKQQHDSG